MGLLLGLLSGFWHVWQLWMFIFWCSLSVKITISDSVYLFLSPLFFLVFSHTSFHSRPPPPLPIYGRYLANTKQFPGHHNYLVRGGKWECGGGLDMKKNDLVPYLSTPTCVLPLPLSKKPARSVGRSTQAGRCSQSLIMMKISHFFIPPPTHLPSPPCLECYIYRWREALGEGRDLL